MPQIRTDASVTIQVRNRDGFNDFRLAVHGETVHDRWGSILLYQNWSYTVAPATNILARNTIRLWQASDGSLM